MNIRTALRLALLMTVFAASQALAQTPQSVPGDFNGLAGTRPSIAVIDDAGKETRGQLLRFGPQSLTMTAKGRELTFDRQQVTRVYQRGDSLKDGTLIGLATGAAIGFAVGLGITDCGFFAPIRCTAGERVRLGAQLGGVLGGLGTGIGVGIDALITGRRLLYERPGRAQGPVISIAPSFARAGANLSLTVGW